MNDLIKELSSFLKNHNILENILGSFEIKEQLGQGGTSIVRRAILTNFSTGDDSFSQEFAIKFLLENIKNKKSRAFNRFKQAHINILQIQHTGYILPQIHFDKVDINDEIQIPYIMMNKASKTLKNKYKDERITFKEFESIFYSLLDAVDIIHENGIIHRDLKPENIFYLNEKLVLGDFDIAKFDDETKFILVETNNDDRLANYLFSAPEQSNKPFNEITVAADWFAVGQILHWLVTGFTLRGQHDIRLNQSDEKFSKYNNIIETLLRQNPSERFKNKKEIINYIKENDENLKNNLIRYENEKSLLQFDQIINKYTCDLDISRSRFKKYSDPESISEIMDDLQEKIQQLKLWCSQGYSDWEINQIEKLDKKTWLLEMREMKINTIWFYKHSISYGGSYIIIEVDFLPYSGAYNAAGEVEEVGLFNEIYITRNEYYTGWALINGKRVDVSSSKLRIRYLKPNIFFIAPKWGPLIENIEIFDKIYKEYLINRQLTEALLEPTKKLRRKRDVVMYD